MPFALLIIGIVLVIVAVRNTQSNFVQLLKGDFTGPANFIYWIVALVVIGSIGYVNKLKPVSDGLLLLVVLILLLTRGNPQSKNGGFFQKFTAALQGTTTGGGGGSSLGSLIITV